MNQKNTSMTVLVFLLCGWVKAAYMFLSMFQKLS